MAAISNRKMSDWHHCGTAVCRSVSVPGSQGLFDCALKFFKAAFRMVTILLISTDFLAFLTSSDPAGKGIRGSGAGPRSPPDDLFPEKGIRIQFCGGRSPKQCFMYVMQWQFSMHRIRITWRQKMCSKKLECSQGMIQA